MVCSLQETEYKGEYWAEHPTIKLFWEVFHGLSLEKKKLFLCKCGRTTNGTRVRTDRLISVVSVRSVPHRKRPHTDPGHEESEAGDPAYKWRGAVPPRRPHLLQSARPSQIHERRDAPRETSTGDRSQSRVQPGLTEDLMATFPNVPKN